MTLWFFLVTVIDPLWDCSNFFKAFTWSWSRSHQNGTSVSLLRLFLATYLMEANLRFMTSWTYWKTDSCLGTAVLFWPSLKYFSSWPSTWLPHTSRYTSSFNKKLYKLAIRVHLWINYFWIFGSYYCCVSPGFGAHTRALADDHVAWQSWDFFHCSLPRTSHCSKGSYHV